MEQILHKAAQTDSPGGAPNDSELALINAYTRREMSADEVYAFTVVLCDNEVDRDGERFNRESLEKLSELFVGKTGIFDHNPSARNQAARIFSCEVEELPGRVTALGDRYCRLKARAYVPKNDGSRDLIDSIDSGILREVSVGCAVSLTRCSICGEDIRLCNHEKGKRYGGRLCCGELCEPTDAYEFSFVAVPAQREAGVIKSACGKEKTVKEIVKKLSDSSALTSEERSRLLGYIEKLEALSKDGEYYRSTLTAEVLRLSAAVQPGVSRETMESVTKGMTIAQLREFQQAFENQLGEEIAPKPQLSPRRANTQDDRNGQFRI